ncbi:MAG TPA: YdeI/OmpD-associated family protein [Myxococcaceae bacterium]|nr:YdeI/OmpD-associated family protein [Myxococcaceae bacterium]
MADLPKIGAAAERALQREGIQKLEQLRRWSESELAALHGVGPKALRMLRESLSEAGLGFKGSAQPQSRAPLPSPKAGARRSKEKAAAVKRAGSGPSARSPGEPTFFPTPADFRAWLEANHQTASELLVGYYKKGTGRPSITWPESVDEALCFGWIDGIRRSLGEEAYCIRFTPRKPTSIWSAVNVARVAALTQLGRMTPAGLAAYEKRRDDLTGIYGHDRLTPAQLDPALRARFDAHAEALEWFQSQAPSYQRITLHWIMNAKKQETRERRFEQVLAASLKKQRL